VGTAAAPPSAGAMAANAPPRRRFRRVIAKGRILSLKG
jgi:hypothetical protein